MTNPSVVITEAFRQSFNDTFKASIQQDKSRFEGIGISDSTWQGQTHTWAERAPLTIRETTGQRGGKTQTEEVKLGKRSGFVRSFEGAAQLDRADQGKLFQSDRLDSGIITELRAAWNRAKDDCFIEAAIAQALGGATAPFMTPQALPSHMTIPVNFQKLPGQSGSNTGLTLYKIQEAITRMKQLDVMLDSNQFFIAISPAQEQSWIIYTQSAKTDHFARLLGPWANDRTQPVLGCRVIVTNRLKTVAGITTAIVGTNQAFKLGPMSETIEIDKLPGERHAVQFAGYFQIGLAREYDELVKLLPSDPAGSMLDT